MGPEPSLEAILRPFPSGRARGAWPDYLLCGGRALLGLMLRLWPGRAEGRPHPRLLSAAAQEVLRTFRDPTCVETACMGIAANGGTESTVSLASVIRGQGRFYCFEEDEERLVTCRRACGNLNQWIRYVQEDSLPGIRRLREEGELERVHLAFLPAVDDPDRIWEEVRALEDLLVPGGLLIVDDALRPGGHGERVKPYLVEGERWEVRVACAGDGLLLAQRRG